MKPLGSLVSAVIGLVMALALVVWAVVAVVVITTVGSAVSLGGSLLRGPRGRFHEPPPSQATSTRDDAPRSAYTMASQDFASGGRT